MPRASQRLLDDGSDRKGEHVFRGFFIQTADALMKRLQPGTPEFIAEFGKIMPSCDIVPLGPAPV